MLQQEPECGACLWNLYSYVLRQSRRIPDQVNHGGEGVELLPNNALLK